MQSTFNETLLNTFPNAQRTTGIYAYLIDIDEQYRWDFLYNPESIQFDVTANYASVPTSLTKCPEQQYLYTSGETHDFNNLLLISYSEEKSLEQHLTKLKSVLYADVENKKYSPPLLYFVWGNYKFGTCRLTKISGERTLVLSGEAAQIMLNMSLVAVPKPESPGGETDPRSQTPPTNVQSTDTPPSTPGVSSTEDPGMDGIETRTATTNDTFLVLPETSRFLTIDKLVSQVKQVTQNTNNPWRFRPVRYSYNKTLKRVEMYDRVNRLIGIAKSDTNIQYANTTNLSAFERRYATSNS